MRKDTLVCGLRWEDGERIMSQAVHLETYVDVALHLVIGFCWTVTSHLGR